MEVEGGGSYNLYEPPSPLLPISFSTPLCPTSPPPASFSPKKLSSVCSVPEERFANSVPRKQRLLLNEDGGLTSYRICPPLKNLPHLADPIIPPPLKDKSSTSLRYRNIKRRGGKKGRRTSDRKDSGELNIEPRLSFHVRTLIFFNFVREFEYGVRVSRRRNLSR